MNTHHVTTATSYGVAIGSFVTGLLNYFTPEEWSAVGVLGGIIVAVVISVINAHFRNLDCRAY